MADLNSTIVRGKLRVVGDTAISGKITSTISWNGLDALPEQTSPLYFLCLDAFADGGTTKFATVANLKNAISLNSYLLKSGGTMTGKLTLASAGLSTNATDGYDVDSHGNFTHKSTGANSNYFHLDSADSTKALKYYWETGALAVPSSLTVNGTEVSLSGHTHSYLPLSGGTMDLGEGLKIHADNNYFGTNADARIISLLDNNDTICDGGLIIDERATNNGTETVTELLRIRHNEFKWKGTSISLDGHTHNYAGSTSAGGDAINSDKLDGLHASNILQYTTRVGKPNDSNYPYSNFNDAPTGVSEIHYGGYATNYPSDWEASTNHYGAMLHFGNTGDNHSQILLDRYTDNMYFRNAGSSTYGTWYKIIHSGNIGSQNVATATALSHSTTDPSGCVRYNNTTGVLKIHSTVTNEKIYLGSSNYSIFQNGNATFTTPAGNEIKLPAGGSQGRVIIAAHDANGGGDYGTYAFGSDSCILANSGDAGLFKIYDKDVAGGDYTGTTGLKLSIEQAAAGSMYFYGGSLESISSSTDTPLRVQSNNTSGSYIEYKSSSGGTFGYLGITSDGNAKLISNSTTKTLSVDGHTHDYLPYTATSTAINVNDTLNEGIYVVQNNITNAAHVNHSALLNIKNVGTPFQLQIPDSDQDYVYKRHYSSSAWSSWRKLKAGYADDSDTCDGLHIHSGRNNEANKIVRTDASGYIQCGYINSSDGNENNASSPSNVWGTNGSDNYLRTYQTSSLSVGNAANLGGLPASQYRKKYTYTVTVNGDSNTYYPVYVESTSDKSEVNNIILWKNLGSPTASYSGNHSNGTSSVFMIWETRTTVWDGNCGYFRTIFKRQDYANLIEHASAPGSPVSGLVFWLRGGGTEYTFSATYDCGQPTAYYESTNLGYNPYNSYVEPMTEDSSHNKGIANTDFTLYGNAVSANYATSAGSAPASDVYSWAKASSKPSYTHDEIGAGNIVVGDGANTYYYRTSSSLKAGFYYHYSGDESVVFANQYEGAGWMFVNGVNPDDRTNWQSVTPTLQIKRGGVVIGKLCGQGSTPSYKLDINGSAAASSFYASSDRRLKDNIIKSNLDCLDIINKLKLKEFNFKDQENKDDKYFGLIAQQLLKTLPDKYKNTMVSQTKDKKHLMSINEGKVQYITMGAVQQLSKKVDKLEKENRELKEIIKEMNKKLNKLLAGR